MKTAFVLKRVYYLEDYYRLSTPIAVSLVEAPLQTRLEELSAKSKRNYATRMAVEEFTNLYLKTHPCPPFDAAKLKQIPKWGSGRRQEDITDAMRQERADIKSYNESISMAHSSLVDAWEKLKDKAVEEFKATLNITESDATYTFDAHDYSDGPTEYFIEPIELVE